jgi:Zn-dependent M28 family amino/carboxypeptidase
MTVVLAAGVAGCGGEESEPSAARDRFDERAAFADLQAQVDLGPRPRGTPAARRAANLIVAGLREAGAKDIDVQRPYLNVVATIPGGGGEAVVAGAHYDTKSGIPGFVGANDGASGVGVLLELARSLPRGGSGPDIHLAFFDAEEARGDRDFEADGTRGSEQYVEYAREGGEQGTPPLDSIEAMVLFDMVGDCDLRIPREDGSDGALYAEFAAAAEEAGGEAAPFTGETGQILDDHVPFLEAGIPAVDLIDFDYGPGPPPGGYWHTPQDTVDKVCADSLDAVGEAAARAIPRLGG